MGKRANKKKEEKEKEQNNVFQGNVSSFGDTVWTAMESG
jgi:hypothetical protein